MTTLDIADRLQIQDLLTQYCHTVDDKDWSRFVGLFTADAVLDFTAFGGPRSNAPGIAEFLSQLVASVPRWQHAISTMLLSCDGDRDTVTGRTAAQVMMITQNDHGADHVAFFGLWYRDVVVRTPSGWKIRERVQEYAWTHNVPATADR